VQAKLGAMIGALSNTLQCARCSERPGCLEPPLETHWSPAALHMQCVLLVLSHVVVSS